ncbi:DUF1801 domain-containing protein [Terrimonas pollutisoli]|uniref:DUF1801 domain-containing protein n=1 Tax=Terrimonas pollutisoli TaxID=3034147 RepID=UPI0023EDC045|nr:DUF1801 domain-containing protein [Terrimonas sp. H1YJ31]
MPKSKDIHDSAAVTAYIQKLDPVFAKAIETLRQVILGVGKEVGEQIKWNSPSFFYTGEMKTFNAKEYKRDIVVMNLHKGNILLVFPTGATVDDSTGLLEGDYTDGRSIIRFKDLADIKAKSKALQQIIRTWLSQVEK